MTETSITCKLAVGLAAIAIAIAVVAFARVPSVQDAADVSHGGTTHFTNLAVKGKLSAGTTLAATGATTLGSTLGVTGASTLTGGAKVGTQYSATNPLQIMNATATAPSANYCDSAAEGGSVFLATSTSYTRLYFCAYHASTTRGWDYLQFSN